MARKARLEAKTPVSDFVREAAAEDRAAALAFFLTEQGETVTGQWKGRLSYADQRTLFGMVIGKGLLYVDGETETVFMTRSVSFGTMRVTEFKQPWAAFTKRSISGIEFGHIAQYYHKEQFA